MNADEEANPWSKSHTNEHELGGEFWLRFPFAFIRGHSWTIPSDLRSSAFICGLSFLSLFLLGVRSRRPRRLGARLPLQTRRDAVACQPSASFDAFRISSSTARPSSTLWIGRRPSRRHSAKCTSSASNVCTSLNVRLAGSVQPLGRWYSVLSEPKICPFSPITWIWCVPYGSIIAQLVRISPIAPFSNRTLTLAVSSPSMFCLYRPMCDLMLTALLPAR